jgi:hypothetical protein
MKLDVVYMPETPALGRLKQEDLGFEASCSYTARNLVSKNQELSEDEGGIMIEVLYINRVMKPIEISVGG